jgi:hypothetical protein
VKKSLLVEAEGGPLGITVAGANVPDTQLMAVTIAAIVLERPPVEDGYEPHLALDTGYDNDRGWDARSSGSRCAVACSFVGRRSVRTTLACSNWPAACSGFAATTD